MSQELDIKMVETICHIYKAITKQEEWVLRALANQDERIKALEEEGATYANFKV